MIPVELLEAAAENHRFRALLYTRPGNDEPSLPPPASHGVVLWVCYILSDPQNTSRGTPGRLTDRGSGSDACRRFRPQPD